MKMKRENKIHYCTLDEMIKTHVKKVCLINVSLPLLYSAIPSSTY